MQEPMNDSPSTFEDISNLMQLAAVALKASVIAYVGGFVGSFTVEKGAFIGTVLGVIAFTVQMAAQARVATLVKKQKELVEEQTRAAKADADRNELELKILESKRRD